jgi:hypothetical protein
MELEEGKYCNGTFTELCLTHPPGRAEAPHTGGIAARWSGNFPQFPLLEGFTVRKKLGLR